MSRSGDTARGRTELRQALLRVARSLEEACLKLLTDIAHCRARGKEAAQEAEKLDSRGGPGARDCMQKTFAQAPPSLQARLKEAYLETSRVIYGMAAARERESELGQRIEFEGMHLEAVQRAVVELNQIVRQLDGGEIDPRANAAEDASYRSRELERSILMAQEDEKRRISIVVHDGPAQLLANLIMRVDFCCKLLPGKPEEAAGELVELRREMQDLLDNVRRLIFDLRPMTLDDLGFIPTIQRFVTNMRATLPFDLQLFVGPAADGLTNLQAVVLYRFVQEAVRNVQRHADAQRAVVRVGSGSRDGWVSVSVEDDGAGFDTDTLPQALAMGRLGLHESKKRIELVGGTFEIRSSPGDGTIVRAEVPAGSHSL